ncbi:MAG: hypothetical protein RIC06_24430 [Cyclobacteriaceae bacterium]
MDKTNKELIENDSSFKFLAIEFNRLYEERNPGDIHNIRDGLYREYLGRQRLKALASDDPHEVNVLKAMYVIYISGFLGEKMQAGEDLDFIEMESIEIYEQMLEIINQARKVDPNQN